MVVELEITPSEPPTGQAGSPPRRETPPIPQEQPPLPDPSGLRVNAPGFWDGENVNIPSGDKEMDERERKEMVEKSLANFKEKVREKFGLNIATLTIFKVGFNDRYMARLRRAGLTAIDVEKNAPSIENRDFVDIEMENQLNIWALLNTPPAPVIIIAHDKDYIRVIQRLKRAGFPVILVVGDTPSRDLVSFNPYCNKWIDLIKDSDPPKAKDLNPIIIRTSPSAGPMVPRPLIPLATNLRVKVLWDLVTCPPDYKQLNDIYNKFDRYLQDIGYLGVYNPEAFLTSGDSSKNLRRNFQKYARGIRFTSLLPPLKGDLSLARDFVDVRIKKAMCLWGMHRQPSTLLVVTTDPRLAWTARQLRLNAGFEMLLAHGDGVQTELTAAFTRSFPLKDIAGPSARETYEENEKKRHGNPMVNPKGKASKR